MTENQEKLLIEMGRVLAAMCSNPKNRERLNERADAVEADRAETDADMLDKCCSVCLTPFARDDNCHILYYCDSCKPRYPFTVERAEPTETEAEVPDDGGGQCNMTRDGIQCCNRANDKAVFQFCKGECDFGPDVPGEGEEEDGQYERVSRWREWDRTHPKHDRTGAWIGGFELGCLARAKLDKANGVFIKRFEQAYAEITKQRVEITKLREELDVPGDVTLPEALKVPPAAPLKPFPAKKPDVPGEGDSDEWIKFIKHHEPDFTDPEWRKQWDTWRARAKQSVKDEAELREKLKAVREAAKVIRPFIDAGPSSPVWLALTICAKAGGK